MPVRHRFFRRLQSFCAIHLDPARILEAVFSFPGGKNDRDRSHFLFSTIAYQLALKIPGLRQHVNHIVELDSTLHTKSMDVQLLALIVNAFQLLSPLSQRSYLVIIDGLDECHDKETPMRNDHSS